MHNNSYCNCRYSWAHNENFCLVYASIQAFYYAFPYSMHNIATYNRKYMLIIPNSLVKIKILYFEIPTNRQEYSKTSLTDTCSNFYQ